MPKVFSRRALLNPFKLLAAGVSLRDGIPLPSVPEPRALPRFLRPPGAVDEVLFRERCDGCGECGAVCPHKAIRLLAPGLAGTRATAAILPRTEACRLCDGFPCIPACDRGALEPLGRKAPSLGTARFLADRCHAAAGQPCDYCVPICPVGPSALHFEEKLPVVGEADCTGCGLCEWICPSKEPALVVEPGFWNQDTAR